MVLNLKQTAHLILKAITAVIPILDGVVTQMGIASVMLALILVSKIFVRIVKGMIVHCERNDSFISLICWLDKHAYLFSLSFMYA